MQRETSQTVAIYILLPGTPSRYLLAVLPRECKASLSEYKSPTNLKDLFRSFDIRRVMSANMQTGGPVFQIVTIRAFLSNFQIERPRLRRPCYRKT
jgi:hypothetical protein